MMRAIHSPSKFSLVMTTMPRSRKYRRQRQDAAVPEARGRTGRPGALTRVEVLAALDAPAERPAQQRRSAGSTDRGDGRDLEPLAGGTAARRVSFTIVARPRARRVFILPSTNVIRSTNSTWRVRARLRALQHDRAERAGRHDRGGAGAPAAARGAPG